MMIFPFDPSGLAIAEALIKHFEGCRLRAYVFPGETWATIGWGHAIPLSRSNLVITQAEADILLLSDLRLQSTGLQKLLGDKYSLLTPGQLGATLSFKYNCKPGLFETSTFLALLKKGDFQRAAGELPKWIHGEQHQVLEGLVVRRKCEAFILSGGSLQQLDSMHWYAGDKNVPL